MKQVLPKILKYFTFGFLLFHNSYGVFLVPSLKYTLLTVWYTMLTAYPQKFLATSLLCNVALAISWITLFFLSTTSFYWRVIGAENSWNIPNLVQKDSIYEFSNSLPWSIRIRSIPWTCFVVIISSLQCTVPSTWLTNCADPSTRLDHQLEKDVSCKVLQFITWWRSWSCLVTKPLQCTKHNSFFKKKKK